MKYIFSVEGNIGSGKSTFVKFLKNSFNNNNVVFLQEPVDTWTTIVDTDGQNIIQKYYSNQEKYSFAFQMMAYISRLSQIKKIVNESPNGTIIITERCLYTDFNIFAKMLYDSGTLSQIEFSIYKRWFDEFIDFSYITAYIYIKTSPEVCLERIASRTRKGEELIPLDYLVKCDHYHREWLKNEKCLEIESTLNNETLDKIKKFISLELDEIF
jgi:deoxyadenosine/deoxycytidine kinase